MWNNLPPTLCVPYQSVTSSPPPSSYPRLVVHWSHRVFCSGLKTLLQVFSSIVFSLSHRACKQDQIGTILCKVPVVGPPQHPGNGDLQTLICVLVARPRWCLTLLNPVPWQVPARHSEGPPYRRSGIVRVRVSVRVRVRHPMADLRYGGPESPDKTEWRLISATLCGWRRCFVAVEFYLYPTVSTALMHLVKPKLTRWD